ncbi:MAG: hypothetical protein M0R48_08630 [Candidatus Omnitrophica bacterium]|nr:hypothetical protein [Candidatus Omnitrophota bacterium]
MEVDISYLHILNLYKDQTVLEFKEVFAMEKAHGTSSHVAWNGKEVSFFAGGESHVNFVNLFNKETLTAAFQKVFGETPAIIYGEAYGGSQQKMSKTYGSNLRFIAFDVFSSDRFWDLPDACRLVMEEFGLDFVPFKRVPATVEALDIERDSPSEIAARNGCQGNTDRFGFNPPVREGIVIRPIHEFTNKWGKRVICKHKRAEFQERQNTPDVKDFDPEKAKLIENADSIAEEWVVAERLNHVLDKLGNPRDLKDTGKVVKAMVEDVFREAEGEIDMTDKSRISKSIGNKTVKLYKQLCTKI